MTGMMSRPLEEQDLPGLQQALDKSKWHPGQNAHNYTAPNGIAVVYEEGDKPIIVFRFTKTLRATACFFDEEDEHNNGAVIVKAIEETVELARTNGYTEIIFTTHNDALAKFCEPLGFKKSDSDYVKQI